MRYFEKDAIISGVGISRIGRRSGIPGTELTLEAARAAIDNAGLTVHDVDGIATFGDTPLADINAALSIQATDQSFGFDTAEFSLLSCRHFAPLQRGGRATCWCIGQC